MMAGLTWTADGQGIIFSSYPERGHFLALWRVGISGGTPEQVLGLGEDISFLQFLAKEIA